ncbi:uncharacterized protein MONOS_9870 [Monocercomonoides exilis]|uniref:uncharacterized protein n=1 Tax=Monocercomonoides exilis TaxID=2049356 RepID=UPI00355964C7|nr:hypothetical protein MONOS_9870 [Monocercomonoides exilis]|eukprot:MONOS_9870.1-p1 / transcript=MONOS_9870.1 / gene=MONOS_9870 / organism=Monocercomonoides_exilis_PA203 / gene_product=unspecified product / transcript_product=unspecified product / location=Mono_scaffold00423:36479-37932(+) / protein_length=386 / sequence_SO=supercontig / SO=protein_coding / is_pseudo=false
MEEFIDGGTEDRNREMAPKEKFSKLFDELKSCSVSEQKEKIEEMNRLIGFSESSLYRRFEEMIVDEEQKKEGKNEKLLIDLIECYLLLDSRFCSDLYPICVPCLLKVALKKEEDEETQKEVEMILLTLSNVGYIPGEIYLNEIKEIILHHQDHHNLTQLAYQSVWTFLVHRLCSDFSTEIVIADELHFIREARREVEELSKSVDWKRKEEGKGESEEKEALVIWRWLNVIDSYLNSCRSWNGELVGLLCSIVQVFRASRDNYFRIQLECLNSLGKAEKNKAVKIDDFLKSGAIGLYLEEMKQSTLVDFIIVVSLSLFNNISERLKEEEDEKEEKERKEMKRKIFEMMEEEGYEDVIAGFHDAVSFLNEKCYNELSLNISDYFVNP